MLFVNSFLSYSQAQVDNTHSEYINRSFFFKNYYLSKTPSLPLSSSLPFSLSLHLSPSFHLFLPHFPCFHRVSPVAQAGLELTAFFMPLPLEYWNYSYKISCLQTPSLRAVFLGLMFLSYGGIIIIIMINKHL